MVREKILKELIKNGYSEVDGKKTWDIADMSFLYLTEEMADSFLKLKDHPRYKATVVNIEMELLKKYSSEFLKCLEDCKFNLVDMGCSEGTKSNLIVDVLNKTYSTSMIFRYCPVSVNKRFIDLSIENIKKGEFRNVVDYRPMLCENFDNLDEVSASLRNSNFKRNVVLFLGSLLGGFEINDYLFRLSQSMFPGDILIIGNGIRKGKRLVNLNTYKHPLFNTWFIHLMRMLGFKDDEVEYDARFRNDRVEGFYRILKDKILKFDSVDVRFKKGDEVLVAFLYKYYADELKKFFNMYFSEVNLVYDSEEEYALALCKK